MTGTETGTGTGTQTPARVPDAATLDRATIRHLQRTGWTTTQIAAFVGCERETIARILRSAPDPLQHAPSALAPLTIRLSHDARRLQIVLPADGAPTPTAALLEQIQAHCARHHLALTLTQEELEARLRTCVYGSWLTIAEAVRPTPPTPERIRVLVPVPLAGRRRRAQDLAATLVRAGTVLAEREPGVPGQPGRDLLGRAIPAPLPRRAHLPRGQNTCISPDGRHLVATCDGRVVLQHLRLHVLPATIHQGDLTAAEGVLEAAGDVIVTGSVREHAAIRAAGDIAIGGSVHSAHIASATGCITVEGAVGGTSPQPSVLQAGGTITCERVLHATLQAGGDIVVRRDVHHSTLRVAGHLYLSAALERTLFAAHLSVGGGVILPVEPPAPSAEAPTERRYTRVALSLAAHLAVYGPPPLGFMPCVIEDLSPGGARCRLSTPLASLAADPADPGVTAPLVQLKIVLPGQDEQIIVLARIAHVAWPDTLGLAFVQITERDADHVMQYYLQGLRDQRTHTGGTPGQRRPKR